MVKFELVVETEMVNKPSLAKGQLRTQIASFPQQYLSAFN